MKILNFVKNVTNGVIANIFIILLAVLTGGFGMVILLAFSEAENPGNGGASLFARFLTESFSQEEDVELNKEFDV